MPKLSARKVAMLIPLPKDDAEATDCFEYGCDLVWLVHRKSQKTAAAAFAERLEREFSVKVKAKAVEGGDLLSDARAVHAYASKPASDKKNLFHVVLTSGDLASAALYAAYHLPQARVVYADGGRIVRAPVLGPELGGGFDQRVAGLGQREVQRARVVAPAAIPGFGSTSAVAAQSRTALVGRVYESSAGASVLATDPFFLLGAHLQPAAVPVYPAAGAFRALPMPKRQSLPDLVHAKVLALVKEKGMLSSPLGAVSKATGVAADSVGRHLKALSDAGFLDIDGRADTVALSALGKLYVG